MIVTQEHLARQASYTAAEVYPVKLLQAPGVVNSVGMIVPYHLQLNPTNRCNLDCEFCSCAAEDRGLEMEAEELIGVVRHFQACGTRAVTITGGGEPLLHADLSVVLKEIRALGISIGLVTNGILLDRLSVPVRWVRISMSDHRALDEGQKHTIKDVVDRLPLVDWAFSYVLTEAPNFDLLREVVRFADELEFTHVRIVGDILNADKVPDMAVVRLRLKDTPGEQRVIYQSRRLYEPGLERCLISLLKPVVGADGGVWPCCGVQYALKDPGKCMEPTMRMGHWTEFGEIMEEQRHFDGSICARCYYTGYNGALAMLMQKLEHREFV